MARVWAKAGLQPHRTPEHLRSENGAEFIAYAIVASLPFLMAG